MSQKPTAPELKAYMEKRLSLRLNANRQVTGVLRGFDHFMNLVLDDAIEDVSPTEKTRLGMVVRSGREATRFETRGRCVNRAGTTAPR